MSENRYKKFIELFKNPKNRRRMENPSVVNEGRNTCGDTIQVYLKIRDGKIADASYEGAFCAFSNASASQVTEFVRGMVVEEVITIDRPKLFELVGDDLSDNPHRLNCILFPLNTIKKACRKYREGRAEKEFKKDLSDVPCHCSTENERMGVE
ncbi:MAG: iron-sulfur cluster assembly scaffold protein [Candidatus Micrarchaeia archaeon]